MMASLMKIGIALATATALLITSGAYAEVIDTFDSGSYAMNESGNPAAGTSNWFNRDFPFGLNLKPFRA